MEAPWALVARRGALEVRGAAGSLVVSQDGKQKLELARSEDPGEAPLGGGLAVFGVLGVVRLLRGWYLGVVTRARAVGVARADFAQALAVDFVPVPSGGVELSALKRDQERRFLAMLRAVVDTQTLYFSHEHDVTQCAQRAALIARGEAARVWHVKVSQQRASQHDRADPRFYWNLHMTQPLVEAGLEDWVHPFMCGFVGAHRLRAGAGLPACEYLLISRRARTRQGTRFNMRGLDAAGQAANFVETEELVLLEDGTTVSHVQTRGSVPTLWEQACTLKYMPRVTLGTDAAAALEAFRQHFGTPTGQHALDKYGAVTAINLIDKVGKSSTVRDQRSLGEAYEAHAKALDDARLRVVWFDFHHECKKRRYQNLDKLLDRLGPALEDTGFFLQRGGEADNVERWQKGVFRTNCMDNLDRTNVVQSVLGRQALARALPAACPSLRRDQVAGRSVLALLLPQLEAAVSDLWRRNANTMSVLYAGTPALKTRPGKLGMLQDGLNSVTRYVINNFADGARQDAIRLFLGDFDVTTLRDGEDTFAAQASWAALRGGLEKLALVFFAVLCVSLYWTPPAQSLSTALATTALLGLTIAQRILRQGASAAYVPQPRLR